MLDSSGHLNGGRGHAARRQAAFAACLLVLLTLLTGSPAAGAAPRNQRASADALPTLIQRTTGVPPHQSWQLPNNAKREWVPFAVDNHYVLMVHEPGFNPKKIRQSFQPNPIRMALVRIGSRVLQPIPVGAYPHFGILMRMSLEYPWIVGVKYTTPQGPLDWVLWAGNVVTGQSIILDRANPGNGPATHTPPDFSLDAGRVVWDSDVRKPFSDSFDSRIAVNDLARDKTSYVAEDGTGRAFYEQPTLQGTTVVWVRVRQVNVRGEHPLYDLLRLDLRTRKIVNLTHNTQRPGRSSGISDEPSAWGHYVIFKQAPSPYSEGDIELFDLRAQRYPLWRQPGKSWLLDHSGEMPRFGDGLAVWDAGGQITASIFDLSAAKVWTLQDARGVSRGKYKYVWNLNAIGGRNVIAERNDWDTHAYPVFFVWHIPFPDRSNGH